MWRYIAGRLVQTVVVLVQVAILVFLLLHIAPGDPVRLMSDRSATPEDLARIRSRLGLDRPLPEQFLLWARNALRGNLGTSIRSGLPVADEIALRYPKTILLTVSSMGIAIVAGIPLGLVASLRHGSMADSAVMVGAVLGMSVPPFLLGLLLILLFSVTLHLLPSTGGETPVHVVLPALALGMASTALIARMIRSTMLEVLGREYIRTAMAKGLDSFQVVVKHALRNALIPTVTVIGLQFGTLMAGAVVTEVVFAYPGVGWLMVQSILNRDFPLVQGAMLVTSFSFILVNLAVDLAYLYLDPRIRYV